MFIKTEKKAERGRATEIAPLAEQNVRKKTKKVLRNAIKKVKIVLYTLLSLRYSESRSILTKEKKGFIEPNDFKADTFYHAYFHCFYVTAYGLHGRADACADACAR